MRSESVSSGPSASERLVDQLSRKIGGLGVKKVAANTRPFLLQTYRRDMGGGNFVLMKDLSSPIFVRGRHWGAFRMGFRQG